MTALFDRSRTACEAAVLLTEAIRELTVPQHLMAFDRITVEAHQVSDTYAAPCGELPWSLLLAASIELARHASTS